MYGAVGRLDYFHSKKLVKVSLDGDVEPRLLDVIDGFVNFASIRAR